MAENRDSHVIASVLEGDIHGFTWLCNKYYGSLVALAYSILGDHHLAEDVAQETFTRALSGLRTLKRTDRFGAWLGKICRYVAYDVVRQRSRSQAGEESRAASEEPLSADEAQKVTAALQQLSPKDRQVIIMRYYHESSYEHMASVLNTSKAAINGRLTRAKHKLAQLLQGNVNDEVKP